MIRSPWVRGSLSRCWTCRRSSSTPARVAYLRQTVRTNATAVVPEGSVKPTSPAPPRLHGQQGPQHAVRGRAVEQASLALAAGRARPGGHQGAAAAHHPGGRVRPVMSDRATGCTGGKPGAAWLLRLWSHICLYPDRRGDT